jgi:hypothetical protein
LTSGGGGVNKDVLVAALNLNPSGTLGDVLWANRFGSTGDSVSTMNHGEGLAVAVTGDVYVAGVVEGALSNQPNQDNAALCQTGTSQGNGGLFLLRMNGNDTSVKWGDCYGAGYLSNNYQVHLGASSTSLVLAGTWEHDIDFGPKVLPGPKVDAFVAHFSPLP